MALPPRSSFAGQTAFVERIGGLATCPVRKRGSQQSLHIKNPMANPKERLQLRSRTIRRGPVTHLWWLCLEEQLCQNRLLSIRWVVRVADTWGRDRRPGAVRPFEWNGTAYDRSDSRCRSSVLPPAHATLDHHRRLRILITGIGGFQCTLRLASSVGLSMWKAAPRPDVEASPFRKSSDCSTQLLTIPCPGAAFIFTSTLPNMMYQFDVSMGASPDWATVNDTPFESYVGEPDAVNWFDSPEGSHFVVLGCSYLLFEHEHRVDACRLKRYDGYSIFNGHGEIRDTTTSHLFSRMANIVKSTSVRRKQGGNCTKAKTTMRCATGCRGGWEVIGTRKAGGWMSDCLVQARHWNNERGRYLEHSSSPLIRNMQMDRYIFV
ncbi:hypothetical protein KCV00_g348, partial [Aureobasidium melanogenum]